MNEPTRPASQMADLYVELRVALLAYLRKHTGDPQAAEDLLHDVVVKALAAGRDEAHAPKNLTGWLYAVARNAAMDYHRRQRSTEALPDDLANEAPDASDTAMRELSGCLRPMAERLPPIYRDTLIAAEFDGHPLRSIADVQGLSLSAIKSRASRGRKLLQNELLACCRVSLSPAGRVLDYEPRAPVKCAAPAACRTPEPPLREN
ncbi:MAG TPA: sigma-70 family RNA polymerase sigma factor [Burkholderiales bacterium]|nr:sigma-70 family RNA polymerase sigma factor [Burkholderiales bacterium]